MFIYIKIALKIEIKEKGKPKASIYPGFPRPRPLASRPTAPWVPGALALPAGSRCFFKHTDRENEGNGGGTWHEIKSVVFVGCKFILQFINGYILLVQVVHKENKFIVSQQAAISDAEEKPDKFLLFFRHE